MRISRYPAGLVIYWKPLYGTITRGDGDHVERIGYSHWWLVPFTKWLGRKIKQ